MSWTSVAPRLKYQQSNDGEIMFYTIYIKIVIIFLFYIFNNEQIYENV